jgi:UDP-GlcNAc:undecaprenyl-phosphate/decaprenyl-phosphate GlcNAc-1-phosphate transferase
MNPNPVLEHTPVFVLGVVMIPVFDTLRVFAMRMWRGKSPFAADRTHMHHLLTNAGYGHVFAVRVICVIHALILMEVYVLNGMRQEYMLIILAAFMILITLLLKNIRTILGFSSRGKVSIEEKIS